MSVEKITVQLNFENEELAEMFIKLDSGVTEIVKFSLNDFKQLNSSTIPTSLDLLYTGSSLNVVQCIQCNKLTTSFIGIEDEEICVKCM
jgi:hypothetical protein